MLNEDPSMLIRANHSCDGLSQRMASDDYRVPDGLQYFTDGPVARIFSKDCSHPFSASDAWRKNGQRYRTVYTDLCHCDYAYINILQYLWNSIMNPIIC